jgi:hypothetical protein
MLFVACGRGKKEGIFGQAAPAPAIHTREKFHKNGWTGRALSDFRPVSGFDRTKMFRDLCAGREFCWAEWLGASGMIGKAVWGLLRFENCRLSGAMASS